MTALLALAFPAAASAFDAHGSARQVYVTGLTPGAPTVLIKPGGKTVTRAADPQGGLLFRNLKPASGYQVRSGGAASPPLTVISDQAAPPDAGVYGQSIPSDGYGYLTTRDGTKLAINVHPPQDVADALPVGVPLPPLPKLPDGVGATPTLIEYSGYGYADPAGPQSGIAVIANLMGFTVVDVNMRGTGCSGGAFDFFEPLQGLDGYDVVETIARQPWVAHHKVGMMGISYGGISQLFTAQLRPPSLAAISPLSVIDATQTTLYPGGILNTGFAVNWAKERVHDAQPASASGGQPWANKRIQEGDATCKANQALHGQAVDLMAKVRANNHYVPKVADPLAPVTFVNKINVPTYMACQWTDEQTGGHCPTLARALRRHLAQVVHVHQRHARRLARPGDVQPLVRLPRALRRAGGAEHEGGDDPGGRARRSTRRRWGSTASRCRATRSRSSPPTRARWPRSSSCRRSAILFDNGAGGSSPGHPLPGFEQSYSRFPVPGTRGQKWYLRKSGGLGKKPKAKRGADVFRWNPHARPLTDFSGDTAAGENGLWTATPPYRWAQNPAGTAASYVTAPLRATTTVIGAGAVHAWIRSSTRNADLQATISEVRPDGKETFVQGGWLRANERKLDRRKSRKFEPVLSLRKRDVKPLPRKRFVKVTIPLYYQGHAYRAGSRIRVTLERAQRRPADLGVRGDVAEPSARRSRSRARRRRPRTCCCPSSACRSPPACRRAPASAASRAASTGATRTAR